MMLKMTDSGSMVCPDTSRSSRLYSPLPLPGPEEMRHESDGDELEPTSLSLVIECLSLTCFLSMC